MSANRRAKSETMLATADTVLTSARLCIASAGGARGWNDTRQSWLARAARHLGMPHCRIRSIWYGRARLYADEYQELQNRAQLLSQRITQAEDDLHASRDSFEALAGGAAAQPVNSRSPQRRARHRAAAAPVVPKQEVKP